MILGVRAVEGHAARIGRRRRWGLR